MNVHRVARLLLLRNQLLLQLLQLEEISAQERIRRLEAKIGPGRGHGPLPRKPKRQFPPVNVYGNCVRQGDKAFLTYTRFTSEQFDDLVAELHDAIASNRHVRMNVPEPTGRLRACKATIENRLLLFLKFLVQGGTCEALGVDFGVHECSIDADLFHVAWALCEQLAYEIQFPRGADINERKGTVSSQYPRVVGVVDCTHTPSPRQYGDFSGHHKQFERGHQLVFDPLGFILHVTAGLSGSRHDSYRWRRSEVPALLEAADAEVLGDSAYIGMTGVRVPPKRADFASDAAFEAAEAEFISKRSRIEQFFSVLKSWFTVAARKWQRHDRDFLAVCFLASCLLYNRRKRLNAAL